MLLLNLYCGHFRSCSVKATSIQLPMVCTAASKPFIDLVVDPRITLTVQGQKTSGVVNYLIFSKIDVLHFEAVTLLPTAHGAI